MRPLAAPEAQPDTSAVRVLLAVPWYFPESVGGTEVFVRSLAEQLQQLGANVTIAVPASIDRTEETSHDGITVVRFPISNAPAELSLDRPEPRGWCDLLDSRHPTVVHLHGITSELELAHLKAARARGARTLLTLHLPDFICGRGTLMRFGATPCSGDLAQEPCTACRLEARGIPAAVGQMLANVPDDVAQAVAPMFPTVLRRALSAGRSDRIRRMWVAQMTEHADRLIAPSRWLRDMLLQNGVPEAQVVVCPQGVDPVRFHPGPRSAAGRSLRVGFVGRYDAVKGLHILIDAVAAAPDDVAIETHVWGIARSEKERAYRSAMIERAHGDPRFVFHEEAASPDAIYSSLDVLAVPSIWLETGPLVVLEAHASSVPVIGSNLGGIAERVIDGRNGVLVPPGSVDDLSRALTSLARDRARLEQLKPSAPRTMTDVALETWRTYQTLSRADAA